MNWRITTAALLLVASVASVSFASSPTLGVITPRGVERGKTHELFFNGGRLTDAQEILFYYPGVTVEKLEVVNDGSVKATVNVAADCRIGEHMAQVRCASGISDFRSFYVGALPQIDEVEPNSSFDEPQAVALNVTVAGKVDNEDVDYYVVDAVKGQRICAEVEGMRLGMTMFDPYVAILDAKRFELSADDDTPLLKQDAMASIVAPEDGKYYVEVRESSYGGNGNCLYRLHLGTFPRPTAVYPAGGKKGEEVEVRYIGDPKGDVTTKVLVPTEVRGDYGVFATDDQGISPSPNPFRVFDHGNSLEVEPNNDIATACAAELPNAFNGIISEPGDVDCFKFAAKAGQVYEVECYARRLRSGLDPVMNIYYADGRGIAGNDDSRGPDSYFRFSVPADGEYVVRVTDHLGRGNPDFVYRVEFAPVAAALTLGIPRVARYSQYRQAVFVPKGNRFATLISVSRGNFGGPIVLEGNGLPAGITMIAEPMPENMTVMPVVFEATADAALSGKLVDFIGRHAENAEIRGGYSNTADFVIGQNQQIFVAGVVDRLPIAVIDEVPFKLEIVQPNVPLVRNGTMNLKVIAQRKEGFTAPINIELPFRPPGIGAPPNVQIPEGQSEVTYLLNAAGNAEIRIWPIYVIGSAESGGAAWVSSQMAKLDVAEPFVNIEMQRASCEQGQETQIYCKIVHAKEFEGEATVQVIGLPAKVTTEPMTITKETQELIFKVKTDPTSPAGNHKNIFCQLLITQNSEPILASTGVTDLQIDVPLPAPTNPPPMPKAEVAQAAPAQPAAPPEKPLSRLEKLRLAAQQAKENGAVAQPSP